MSKKFDRIASTHPLIERLTRSIWWKQALTVFEGEKDINIQMRNGYLNIYYKMNNLGKVFCKKGEVGFNIHNEFLPEGKRRKKDYVELVVQDPFLMLPRRANRYQFAINIFSKNNLKLLKRKVAKQAHEEKTYQSKLIWRNQNTIVDAEVAFNEQLREVVDERGKAKTRRTRIDLLNFDCHRNKLVAIELKMAKNTELYNGKIRNQLQKYTDFLVSNKTDLQQAYKKAIETKIVLGLLEKTSLLARVAAENIEVEPRPLLVVICHNQKGIDACRQKIEDSVRDLALGVYFFGKGGDLNISKKNHKNKALFPL